MQSTIRESAMLPTIRDITWVTPETISEKRVELGEPVKQKGIKRASVMYKYDNGIKGQFVLAPVKDKSAYFQTNGVEEDSYVVAKTGAKTKLGRNVVKLFMDVDNTYHEQFYETLQNIKNSIRKKMEKKSKTKCDVSIKGLYDLKNKEKEVTGHVLVARIIESNRGEIYSAAYDDEEQLDISGIGRCQIRPALIFGYIITGEEDEEDDELSGNYKISVSISQAYISRQQRFPLRDRE